MRSRFDVLTPKDIEVLRLLRKQKEGIGCYPLAKEMQKNPQTIYDNLSRLIRLGFVTKVLKSPAIYKINATLKPKLITHLEVACPKCKAHSSWIMPEFESGL